MNAYPLAGDCWPFAIAAALICLKIRPRNPLIKALRTLTMAVSTLLLTPIIITIIT